MMECGSPAPLGPSLLDGGVNFAVYSGVAEEVLLCLLDERGRERDRLPLPDCDGGVWYGHVPGIGAGQRYGYRVRGPWSPEDGLRCNPAKLLIDPYARALEGRLQWSPAIYDFLPGSAADRYRRSHLDSAGCVPLSRVIGAVPEPRPVARVPWAERVIYEANVRGYTMRHPGLTEAERGRFLGMANGEILDYLKALGVTSIELLPVHAFADEAFLAARGLRNFWGYNSLNFFTPAGRYGASDPTREFVEMVDAIHDAGLEVFLDVVYNHTAEGGPDGPALSFRGLDNLAYYRTLPAQPAVYDNVTGCGNATNADHPAFGKLVIDSLAYWHAELGVDGFRFDLAVTLGRGLDGFDAAHPLLEGIRSDPRLKGAALIAEPWDVGPGGYQLGSFPEGWSEWNDQFRDGARAFWRGDAGVAGAFAERLHGSADLFDSPGRDPSASINYVTSHDGFTLADTVSYEHRHNLANGEGNRDGHPHNLSCNHGVEGPTDDPGILALRRRQRLNLLASLLLAQGVPMLLAGDEFGNSQQGNNNAYCQDNETGWVDWSGLEGDPAFTEQIRSLIALRRRTPLLRHPSFVHGDSGPCIDWLGPDGTRMSGEGWLQAHCFGLHLCGPGSGGRRLDAALILLNAGSRACRFVLPDCPAGPAWREAYYSGAARPRALRGGHCHLQDHSIACLLPAEPAG